MADTSNTLSDFDLCIALGEVAVNSQLSAAWRAWKKRGEFSDTISLFKTKKKGEVVDAKTGLTAKIAPLEIGLNVPDGKLGQVRVTLRLTSGSVTYVDEEAGDLAEAPVEDWTVSFIADLDRKPVDRAALAVIDPDGARTVDDVVAASGLPDDVFSIEYMFLRLTNVDLMLAGNKEISIPPDVPSAARDRALSALNLLLNGELGEYPLGTVVRRNARRATPTFALTDFVMHVHPHPTAPQASTLAYLGVFNRRPLPADLNAARLALRDAWVSPDRLDGTEALVSGVMALSRSALLNDYLIPKFAAAIGHQPTSTGPLSWTFELSQPQEHEQVDVLRHHIGKTDQWRLTLTVDVGTNRITLSGRVDSSTHYNGYALVDLAFWDSDPTIVQSIHAAGHKTLSGTVVLTGSGQETDFRLDPDVHYEFSDLVVDDQHQGGMTVVNEAFASVLAQVGIIGSTPAQMLQSGMRTTVEALEANLRRFLDSVDVDLSQHAFVPPGGGVYALSNPRFSAAGDMLLDVVYKAPRATVGTRTTTAPAATGA
jgi:hypothetical protein